MSLISARVVLDSVSPQNHRLTTVECTFPRIILAEIAMHRAFSRGSASSRAIPVRKMLNKATLEPYIPEKVAVNKAGMQGEEYFSDEELKQIQDIWLAARDQATYLANKLLNLNVHKQTANRLLEPFLYHTMIISSTDWDNFFNQRLSKHGMAQPEMGELADCIYEAIHSSTPKELGYNEWHTPYIQPDEENLSNAEKMRLSTSRNGRVSFLNHNGVRSLSDDYDLFNKLLNAFHPGPFEHVATPDSMGSGNFQGWTQLRFFLERGTINDILEINS